VPGMLRLHAGSALIVSGELHWQCRAVSRDVSKDNRDGTESYFVAIDKRGATADSLAAQVSPVLTS